MDAAFRTKPKIALQLVQRAKEPAWPFGALALSCLQPSSLFAYIEQCVEEQPFSVPFDQPLGKFTEHARIEARVSEFQSQQIFPIDPAPNGIGGLSVG